jgi:mono/diheme cytochrome c family protein
MTRRENKTQRATVSFAALLIWTLTTALLFAQNDSSTISRNKNSSYAELAKAPAKDSARPNPLQGDRDAVAAGGKLFARHCAQCHGDLAQGTRRAPTLLAGSVRQATPGTLFWNLTNGVVRHGMPVWSKLPEPQRWQLVSYLKSLTAEGVNMAQ